MKKLLLTIAITAGLAACSDSDTGAPTTVDGEGTAVLQALENQGLTIHGSLDVPGGLSAYAASAGAQAMAIYILPDENYAVVGTLLDAQGNPVGEAELRQIVSEPIEQGAWEALEGSNWIPDGDPDAERIVYTFMDANCPFCNELWHSARPWVEAGNVQLRHIMVGVIRADSAAKAAAILESEDPTAALTQNELNKNNGGGIEPLETIPPEIDAQLKSNVELMGRLGFGGTPGLVAKKEDGSLTFQSGVPRGPALEELFGAL